MTTKLICCLATNDSSSWTSERLWVHSWDDLALPSNYLSFPSFSLCHLHRVSVFSFDDHFFEKFFASGKRDKKIQTSTQKLSWHLFKLCVNTECGCSQAASVESPKKLDVLVTLAHDLIEPQDFSPLSSFLTFQCCHSMWRSRSIRHTAFRVRLVFRFTSISKQSSEKYQIYLPYRRIRHGRVPIQQ